MNVRVRRVTADVVLPLRHAVLRTGRAWADALYDADDDPLSAHFAAFATTRAEDAMVLADDTTVPADDTTVPADDTTLLAVGSVLPESPDWLAGDRSSGDRSSGDQKSGDRSSGDRSSGDQSPAGRAAWRVRGMATRPDQRGSGIGGLVLAALLDHVRTEGGRLVWCSARLGALTFYVRAGFVSRGDPGHVEGMGPHQTMWRHVEPAPSRGGGDVSLCGEL